VAVTAAEQLLIELINRARLDPGAESARLGIDLNQGLDPGTITDAPMEALAFDAALAAASQGHSAWMLANDVFSHDGAGGSDAGERMADAGYDFSGSWAWGENLAWVGNSGAVDLNAAIIRQYDNLFESAGHRENTLDPGFRQIGVAQEAGSFRGYNAAMLTENFARAGTTVFVTGVVYHDRDDDGFYGIGEGRGGLEISADPGDRATAAAAGGYSLATDAGPVTVTLEQDGDLVARLQLDLSQGNAKLDLVEQADGRLVLQSSVDTVLLQGLSAARLIGAGDLDLAGLRTANRLWGNSGDNEIIGGGGADRLWAYGGDDALTGGRGRDRLDGGQGDDILTGGQGSDQFIFTTGDDRVTDFARSDRIVLDGAALEGTSLRQVLDAAAVTADGLVLTLATGTLTLDGLTGAEGLGGRFILLD
jgi:Ca2+-binding RTX toxin-like protein